MTRGRVYAREMYQFASRGIPIWQVLLKELGVNTEQLSKMITKGQVGFPQLERALQSMSSAGGRYYGLSDKIAQTTYGKLSNLEDKWKVALSQIGAANEGIINSSIEMTSTLISNWEKVADTIKNRGAISKNAGKELAGEFDQAHHLIPVELIQKSDILRKAIDGGFEFNGKINSKWLKQFSSRVDDLKDGIHASHLLS